MEKVRGEGVLRRATRHECRADDRLRRRTGVNACRVRRGVRRGLSRSESCGRKRGRAGDARRARARGGANAAGHSWHMAAILSGGAGEGVLSRERKGTEGEASLTLRVTKGWLRGRRSMLTLSAEPRAKAWHPAGRGVAGRASVAIRLAGPVRGRGPGPLQLRQGLAGPLLTGGQFLFTP